MTGTSSTASCAGIAAHTYKAWNQARNDHGTRRSPGAPVSLRQVSAVTDYTVGALAGRAYAAGFSSRGVAGCTPDPGLGATAPRLSDARRWPARPGVPVAQRDRGPGRPVPCGYPNPVNLPRA